MNATEKFPAPMAELRYVERTVHEPGPAIGTSILIARKVKVLQQKWQDGFGNTEWFDVPTYEE